ncbi:MAG: ABC transporter ATP-binding protein [Opitutaceae bacterium]|nr:ABC transporter ATP-binding protein [Opitutaceae bacterium]
MGPLLELRNVSKVYPTKRGSLHAVDGVDLDIFAGESVGLVGESGCGKSTLARLVARLADPTGGTIHFAGRPIGAIPAAAFAGQPERGRIQKVFQDAGDSLNPRITVAESIAEPLELLRGLSDPRARHHRVAELADLVALPRACLDRYPHQLSGGQRARAGIARALGSEPSLLVLDEPTAALDVSVQAVILRLLADLRARLGVSYLFVSHDLQVVRLLCPRIAVMYLGRIVETGDTATVFAQPQHPYTRALLSAAPGGRHGPRIRLDGEVRSPINPPPRVCRFHGRCPQGRPECTESAPALRPTPPGTLAACHFPSATPPNPPS